MRRLTFVAYRAALPKRWRIARNRYYVGTAHEQTIGLGVQIGDRALGVTWRSPRSPKSSETPAG